MEEWYLMLSQEARAEFDVLLDILRVNEQRRWSYRVEQLTNYPGIYEIRFKHKNIQHRPLGFFGPHQLEFTFLIPAREQGDRFKPKNAPKTAINRRSQILENEELADEYNPDEYNL
ncbi:MAG: hypothetical protein WAW37_03855 [Syntrophobacteraceae bacterium]